ncbi:MAG: spermidine/putrescine ABC transporter substrate-binding protein, partial [Ruminococcus sp.]|nr:spermidine/putrescine ABC transporter substrate-binding protein [Ruminococcus sp.]
MNFSKRLVSVVTTGVLAFSGIACLAGCGKGYDGEVNVYNWGEYISRGEDGLPDVIKEFEKETNIKVNYTTYETNEEL